MVLQVISRCQTVNKYIVTFQLLNERGELAFVSEEFTIKVTDEQWERLVPELCFKVSEEPEK